MITMNKIIREGHPTLRQKAVDVSFPIDEKTRKTALEMMEFLVNSQDPVLSERYHLRAGVGLAAPQINLSKRMTAVRIPSANPDKDEIEFSDILINPVIVSHSVQEACLKEGEGCLSVDRDVEGFVPRASRITLEYKTLDGEKKKVRLKDYNAIVVQHEIDHLNGILFYDHIDSNSPFATNEKLKVI